MEGLLPVGSIVVLEKAPDILYMIAGYYPAAGAEVRDYAAVRYPAGLGDTMKLELFSNIIRYRRLGDEGVTELNFSGDGHGGGDSSDIPRAS